MARTAVILTAVAMLAACATATPEENAGSRVDVQVVNDIMPPTPMSVFIVHDRGGRTRLGTAQGNDTTRFDFPAVSGRYHLEAESRVSGARYASQAFTPMPSETFAWHMRANILAPVDR